MVPFLGIQIYRILAPTFTALLDDASPEDSNNNHNNNAPTHLYAVRKLVSMASRDPAAFKLCTESALDQTERLKLESSIRRHLISPQEQNSQIESASPAISLKSFG